MKKMLVFLMLALFIPMAFAAYWVSTVERIDIVEKDSSWNPVEGGAHGVIELSYVTKFDKIMAQKVRAKVWDLEPKTKYTLIYYGDETHNDVYPYATCLKTFKTSTQGYKKTTGRNFEFSSFLDDGVAQKFWVVKASDVDCKNNVMTAWDPNEYLFEMKTI